MLHKAYIKEKHSNDVIKDTISLIHEDEDEDNDLSSYDTYIDVYNANNDFKAWIKIEDTRINYPIMQSNEPNYYLRRGFDKSYDPYGVPYIQEDCNDTSYNLIIYGHNTDNGTMFHDLCKYLDYDFYLNHKIINFDTLQEFGKYEIFAVFKTNVNDFKYYEYVNGNDFDYYVDTCKSLSLYDCDVDIKYGDKLITLSTCEHLYESDDRIVVVARRIHE